MLYALYLLTVSIWPISITSEPMKELYSEIYDQESREY